MGRYLTVFLLAFGLAGPAAAQELTGTLKRIADTGEIRIGFVPDATPMSFVGDDGNPTGYSIALCLGIANAVKKSVGLTDIKISYVPLISPEDRLRAVEDGTVDIECVATTVTLSRRKRVDFSLLTFITGAAVLSDRSNPINSIADLSGKTIAVIKGTTTDSELRNFIVNNEMKITIRIIATHDEGMELLNDGRVDGYASDRAMLIGQVFRSEDRSRYAISRDVFSFEPYAMMLRRGDSEFRLVVDRALANIYRGARIRRLYQDWFGRYGEPLTPILEAMYEFQAVKE
jgi:glutamate/aspartate transport system substrate-binding protein